MTSPSTARPSRSRLVLAVVGGVVALVLVVWLVAGLLPTTEPGDDNPLRTEATAVIEELGGVAVERPADENMPYRVLYEDGIDIATNIEAVEAEVARIEAVLAERGGWVESPPPDVTDTDFRIHRSKLINKA
ncbi:hypothetical protein [Parenemella sanctibonifatiensis]|uniref:hypothetical protein n=1 Tax=Parenemella sanctibonifatiensis TaxID=2016505 RepID=UPI00117C8C88|nr:hypothetical protein [Parenemella sanctibonifatiensis]